MVNISESQGAIMQKICMSLVMVGSLFVASMATALAEGYKLRPGDDIQISVWGEDAMKQEVKVLPDGSITYPLAGKVQVAGLETPEVEVRITEKLKAFIPDPQVSVVVTKIEGNRVFILGKVTKPGPVAMTGPMTVLEALSSAGGLDKFANQSGIKVIRTTPQGQKAIDVNYDKLIRGQSLESNIVLMGGDTIVVP
jgi:polysaccharide export outer membrane protein